MGNRVDGVIAGIEKIREENFSPSYRELAEKIGIGQSTLYAVITRRSNPSKITLKKMEQFIESNDYDNTIKECIVCKKIKPRNSGYFEVVSGNRDGFTTRCRACIEIGQRDKIEEFYDNLPEGEYFKECVDCKQVFKGNTDNFYEVISNPDGLGYYCKSCNTLRGKGWVESNREHRQEYNREYYDENAEKFREITRKFREENPEYVSTWVEENPEKAREAGRWSSRMKRARDNGVEFNYSRDEWEELKEHFNQSCAFCGEELGLDLSQSLVVKLESGGSYDRKNILPSCMSCVTSRGRSNLSLAEWYTEGNSKHYTLGSYNRIMKWLKEVNNESSN